MKIGKLEGKDFDRLIRNDAILAFHTQINNNLSLYLLSDSIIDEYEDENGIDNANSVNILYNSDNDYYSLGEGDIITIDNMEYSTDALARTAYPGFTSPSPLLHSSPNTSTADDFTQ